MTSIGIVICVYNGERFVDSCLASVVAQTRRPDQVVVVDDGSADASAQRVRSWSALLPLELLVHEENRGLGGARRTGLEALRTDLALLLDIDDYWFPDHVEVLERTYERHGGLVMPSALNWRPGERVDLRPRVDQHRVPPPAHQMEAMIMLNYVFSGAMFSLDDYRRFGPFRDLPCSEDWDLWLRMCLGGMVVSAAESPTCLYRVHGGSMSAADGTLEGEVRVLESFRASLDDPVLRRVTDRSLLHRRARLALRAAYAAARAGRGGRARVAALGALRGPMGVKLRALSVLVAPRLTVRRRDAAQQ